MVSRNGTLLDQTVFTLQALAWVYFLEVETLIYVTTSRLASSVGLRAGLGLGRACVSVNIYVNLPQARPRDFSSLTSHFPQARLRHFYSLTSHFPQARPRHFSTFTSFTSHLPEARPRTEVEGSSRETLF